MQETAFWKIFSALLILPSPVLCDITSPHPFIRNVGQDAVFTWNSTNGHRILEAKWGLLSDGLVKPLFIYVDINGYQVLGNDVNGNASRYKGRVYWVGNLNAGRVWFKLTNLTLNDTNQYLADILEHGKQSVKYSTKLTVAAIPKFLNVPTSPHNIEEGKDLIVHCTAIGPPKPEVTWIASNGTELAKGQGTATLYIKRIQRHQSGIYKCLASNNPDHGAVSADLTVTVMYSPEITKITHDITVDENGQIELNCETSGIPSPNITWLTKGTLEYNDTLRISSASRNDSGNYTCRATNIYGTDKRVVEITVRYRPSILRWTETQRINETDPLNLSCTANGYPPPNITWTKIPGTITPSVTGGNVYSVPSAIRSDGGTYTCTASNQIGSAEKLISVIVQYQPTISNELSSKENTSWNGRQLTLKCIVDGLPIPSITWYKPSGQQIATTVGKSSHVTVTTTESGTDYGLYKCVAVNVAGGDEHFTNVTQLFPPGLPDVTISDEDIQASSVTVRWTKPGYDGGSPVINYKVQINSQSPQEHSTARTEHIFTDLNKNTKYKIRVYARNVVGYGNASIKTFTTKKRGAPALPELHLRISENVIILSWTKPDEKGGQIRAYTIYQKQGVEQNEWKRIIVIHDLSNMTYAIRLEDLEPGQKYWFIVTATNEFGESEKGDVKGEYYNIPKGATSTPTATTASESNGETKNNSSKEDKENCSLTLLTVFIALFVISFLFNLFLLLYIWRNITRKEQNGKTNTQMAKTTTKQRAVEDPVYDNAIEMEEKKLLATLLQIYHNRANQLGNTNRYDLAMNIRSKSPRT